MDSDLTQESTKKFVRRRNPWKYKTKEELERDNPSRADGLSPQKEAQWRRECFFLMQKAGMQLKIPQWGISVAAILCYRFYSRKSMKRNDRLVIATACLFLAAKMEESPKSIKDVVKTCKGIHLAKKPHELQKALEPEAIEAAKEEVLLAERAILYALDFDLRIDHPYTTLVQRLGELKLLKANQSPDDPFRHLMQNTWNFVNDSFRTNLCLRVIPEHIAFAALYLAGVMNRKYYGPDGDLQTKLRQHTGDPTTTFFTYFKINRDQVLDVAHDILDLYEEAKFSKGGPTTAGMIPPSMRVQALMNGQAAANAGRTGGHGNTVSMTPPPAGQATPGSTPVTSSWANNSMTMTPGASTGGFGQSGSLPQQQYTAYGSTAVQAEHSRVHAGQHESGGGGVSRFTAGAGMQDGYRSAGGHATHLGHAVAGSTGVEGSSAAAGVVSRKRHYQDLGVAEVQGRHFKSQVMEPLPSARAGAAATSAVDLLHEESPEWL